GLGKNDELDVAMRAQMTQRRLHRGHDVEIAARCQLGADIASQPGIVDDPQDLDASKHSGSIRYFHWQSTGCAPERRSILAGECPLQLGVYAASRHQLVVGATLDHATARHDQDLMSIPYGR